MLWDSNSLEINNSPLELLQPQEDVLPVTKLYWTTEISLPHSHLQIHFGSTLPFGLI